VEAVNALKSEDRDKREAEKERKALQREKEAKAKAKASNSSRGSSASSSGSKKKKKKQADPEEELAEVEGALAELDAADGDAYDGDPADRKALLQHAHLVRARRKGLAERKLQLEQLIASKGREHDKALQKQERLAAAADLEKQARQKMLLDAMTRVRVLPVGQDRFRRNYWFLGPTVDAHRDAASTEGPLVQAHLFLEDPATGEWAAYVLASCVRFVFLFLFQKKRVAAAIHTPTRKATRKFHSRSILPRRICQTNE
jgi:hypothetical protein